MRHIPLPWRDKIRVRAVRPAGSRWLPARLKDVAITTSHFAKEARLVGSQVQLKLDDGSVSAADHVLLGPGYSVDISRYAFLTPGLIERMQLIDGYPALQSGFRSSYPCPAF